MTKVGTQMVLLACGTCKGTGRSEYLNGGAVLLCADCEGKQLVLLAYASTTSKAL